MYSRRAGAILGCANSKKTRLLLKVVTRSDVISRKFDFARFTGRSTRGRFRRAMISESKLLSKPFLKGPFNILSLCSERHQHRPVDTKDGRGTQGSRAFGLNLNRNYMPLCSPADRRGNAPHQSIA